MENEPEILGMTLQDVKDAVKILERNTLATRACFRCSKECYNASSRGMETPELRFICPDCDTLAPKQKRPKRIAKKLRRRLGYMRTRSPSVLVYQLARKRPWALKFGGHLHFPAVFWTNS